jgi:hypothetical protein
VTGAPWDTIAIKQVDANTSARRHLDTYRYPRTMPSFAVRSRAERLFVFLLPQTATLFALVVHSVREDAAQADRKFDAWLMSPMGLP